MKHYRLLTKTFFIVFLIFLLPGPPLSAKQELILERINPKKTNLSIFHSFRHKTLFISLVNKEKKKFHCQPNRYYFYKYGKERFLEMAAGDLKVSSDFSKIFFTKVHTLGSMSSKNSKQWIKKAKRLMSSMNISAETMENGKTSDINKTTFCWQQPELLDLKTKRYYQFPYLTANMCKTGWCSEIFWEDEIHTRFWVQIMPKKLHLIKLNTSSRQVDFLKESALFTLKSYTQQNVPRRNLITPDSLKGKSIVINSPAGGQNRLSWKKKKNGLIVLTLKRQSKAAQASKQTIPEIETLVDRKKFPRALRLIDFSLWLNPENRDAKYKRLQIFASLLHDKKVFEIIKRDFSEEEKQNVCQKMHLDEAFKKLWRKKQFISRFNKNCF